MIRILWLYQYASEYDFDKWLHMEYARFLKNYSGIDLIAYGPKLHEGYADLTPIPYIENLTLSNIRSRFNFDVIICNTKSRQFNRYSPKLWNEGKKFFCYLPRDFKDFNCPKVMIEEDYHYELNDVWYKKMGFGLLLQRHWSSAQRKGTVKTFWHPFSVDIDTFKPGSETRLNKICLAGHRTHEIYVYRKMVSDHLKDKPYFDLFSETTRKINENYVNVLKRYVCYVSGSSVYNITPAKMFEIMSSGGLLFTNSYIGYGLEELFPEDCYETYSNDGLNIVQQATRIVDEQPRTKAMAERGMKYVREHHNHTVRTEELLGLMRTHL